MIIKRSLIQRLLPSIKNSGLYFSSSIFVAVIGIILNPIYALNLSHEDYAIVGYYSSFNLLLAPLLHFCLFSFYSRHFYFIPENEREDLGNTVAISSLIIGIFAFIFFTFFFYLIYINSEHNLPFYPYAVLTFLQLYVANITTFYTTQLRVKRQAKKFATISILQCIITTIFTLLLVVYYKYGAAGKLWGALIASIIMAIYSIRLTISKWKINVVILKKGLKFCWPLVLSAVFWYFLSGIDRIFLEKIDDIKSFGLYSVGLQIAGYMTIFYTTLNNTFEPDIYQSIAQHKKLKLVGILGAIISSVIFFNGIFILFAPQLIDLLTAGRYIEAAPYAQILSIHNITMACYYLVIRLLIGYGYVKQELGIRILGALISIGIYAVMIKKWQFYGAAWGQVISFATLALLGTLYILYARKLKHKV